MKRINIFYWIFTGLMIPALVVGSVIDLIMGTSHSIEAITSLGYPAYLSPFLVTTKILALIAIFTPKFPRLKEWAYAGLVFDAIGATYSQVAVGNPLTYTIFPIIALGVIFGSYYFHHKRLTTIEMSAQ